MSRFVAVKLPHEQEGESHDAHLEVTQLARYDVKRLGKGEEKGELGAEFTFFLATSTYIWEILLCPKVVGMNMLSMRER